MSRYVVEADGGSRGNPGPAGYGAVVRDADSGEVLVEVAEHIGRATNNVAEYRGLIAGLTAVRTLDPSGEVDVEVRMDSKLVVEQMSGRWQVKHPALRPLALEARRVLPHARIRYRWVPREENKEADRLANEAMDDAAAGRVRVSRRDGDLSTPVNEATTARPAVDEAEVEPPPVNRPTGFAADVGTPTTLVLLRHGETEHTVERRFSGSRGADPPLTERGRSQAQRAASALAARGTVDVILSSPLQRARETAEAVAAELGLDVRVEDGFAECAFGEWDGLTFAEVQDRWPAQLDAWLASTSVAPPGGESVDQVTDRVRLASDKALARYAGRTVLIVTHVTPIKALVRLALDAPAHAVHRMELAPASLAALQWWPGGQWVLRLFNDTAHLRE